LKIEGKFQTYCYLMEIELIKGDITQVHTDVTVNAANSLLMGGGGVDGAIHRAGGPEISMECRIIRDRQGGCPAGEAVITSAGLLPAKYVIHTVGPVWRGGNSGEDNLLAQCYTNSLKLAVSKDVKTIAFPNISTGVYGFPKERAAGIAINTVCNFSDSAGVLQKIIFVCFDGENYAIYRRLLSTHR
jgi:O-acetyl-ADP-ribose deacetylase (regulator of RNase III)